MLRSATQSGNRHEFSPDTSTPQGKSALKNLKHEQDCSVVKQKMLIAARLTKQTIWLQQQEEQASQLGFSVVPWGCLVSVFRDTWLIPGKGTWGLHRPPWAPGAMRERAPALFRNLQTFQTKAIFSVIYLQT